MENLRVSLIQADLVWEDRSANLEQFDQQLSGLAGQTDLIVLPEMFASGFTMNAEAVAETMDGQAVDWMRQQAARTAAVVTGSLVIEADSNYYNRLIWMRPDGDLLYYDKRHCFTLAGEDRHYTAGAKRLTVEWKGWHIMPLICYDLRFPVWSRNDVGYDLLLYVANFPDCRRQAWNSLLVARAIENQAYTIGVNRVGTDGNDVYYSGDTCLIDYLGDVHYRLSGQAGVFTAVLSASSQAAFRQRHAFLQDRDEFEVLL